jgi:integrase
VPSTRYDERSYAHAVRSAIIRANRTIRREAARAGTEPELLAHWTPNQLRHAAATEIRKRFGLESSRVVLGHSKANTTEIYAERDQALAVRAMEMIG